MIFVSDDHPNKNIILYFQIVAKVEHLLGNELDLLQNPELCHEIIQSLDKASQVFTDVVINLDILLGNLKSTLLICPLYLAMLCQGEYTVF